MLSGLPTFPRASGTLDDWKQAIGVHIVRNPYLLVVVLAAMMGLLGRAFGLPRLVLMLVGGSSLGKTTALIVGQSLLTFSGRIDSFSGTTKGLLASFLEHSDYPLFRDELRQADVPADIIRLIFDLDSDASRKTSSASQSSCKSTALSSAMILANESNLSEIASGSRVKIPEGVGARVLELNLQAPNGVLQTTPEGKTAKQHVEYLQLVSTRLHGSFWNAYVPLVAKNALNIRKWLAKEWPEVEAQLLSRSSVNDPVTQRLVRGMAAWACAGLLAVRFQLLDTDRKTIMAAIHLVLEEHLQRNTHGSHRIAEQVISTVVAYIDQNPNKFLPLAEFDSSNQSGIYGYRRGHGKDAEFLFLPSVFEKLVGEKYGTAAAARALKTAGYLKCKDVGYQLQVRIPGSGGEDLRKRFYSIDGSIRFECKS